ncbi:hypothetical protein M758_5G058100 [Ceratodon purpureus]|nr:hypothetical protein M758_5G058100 [Ceratodon purpureus]
MSSPVVRIPLSCCGAYIVALTFAIPLSGLTASSAIREAKSSVIKAHGGAVRTVAFSCDGRCLLTGSDDKTIKVWLVQGQKFLATLTGHINWVRSAEFHPDGGTIVSGSDDRTVRLWDFERHECLQQFSDGMGMINSVRFHPNGSLLGTGGSDNCVQIWDIRSKMLVQHYAANAGVVNSVCFHPSGNFLLSTCEDSTIRIWDLREGQILYSLQGHEGPTLCAEFSPTGEYFASGSADEHVMLWRTNFDESVCLPQDGSLGPIHEEGPHIANCMACQCSCKTSKDLADKILGGDTRTNISDPKVKQTSGDNVPKDMDPNLSPCSGRSPNRSPPRQRSSPKHRRAQSPQRSPKKACQASFEVRKENEKISNPPSREGSVAHSPIKKNSRSKSPEPSNSSLESFGRTLEHIVGQLDVLTRTISLFEERLSHTENKVSYIIPLSSYCIEEIDLCLMCLVVHYFLAIYADVENRESQKETKTKNGRSLNVATDAKRQNL